ncbi:hypothetical protein ACFXJO_24195 [Streptomyces lavendulae]|uniref:hypothetical protein n=1 Tax=Streptomyces lavendulae TaxID=1914 RepID=UPI0036C33412
MRLATRTRRLYRTAATGVLTCGLAVGYAGSPAQAAPGAQLLRLELTAPRVTVAYQDLTGNAVKHSLVLTPPPGSGARPRTVTWEGSKVPTRGRVLTQTLDAGIRPDTAYCGVIESVLSTAKTQNTDPVDQDVQEELGTDPGPVVVTTKSNQICTGPAGAAGNPADVSVGSIDGEAAPPPGTNRNYWINYANRGTTEAKDVTIQVQATGTMSMRRPPDSGTFNGFQCSASGSGYRCTGGTLPAGAKGQIPFLGRIASAGPGAIHVTISAPGESDPTNNAQTLTILSAR